MLGEVSSTIWGGAIPVQLQTMLYIWMHQSHNWVDYIVDYAL